MRDEMHNFAPEEKNQLPKVDKGWI